MIDKYLEILYNYSMNDIFFMNDRDKIIYLAGIIDGEGHFYRPFVKAGHRESGYKEPRLVIANTDKTLIDWLASNFGGYVYAQKKQKAYYKQAYQWVIAGKRATMIASMVSPFLIVKREQVKRLLTG